MFIVLEGVDSSGKSTHAKLLANHLGAVLSCYPNRETPIGQLIDGHLKGDWRVALTRDNPNFMPDVVENMDALVLQALMTTNKYETMPDMRASLRVSPVVADRWWPSAYAYGKADGLDGDYLYHLHKALPTPDLYVLLDVPTDIAVERLAYRHIKSSEKPERYEREASTIARVIANYRELWMTNRGDSRWKVVSSDRSIDDTALAINTLVDSMRRQK